MDRISTAATQILAYDEIILSHTNRIRVILASQPTIVASDGCSSETPKASIKVRAEALD